MKLDHKNIIVTGANRGIGAAIVRELLKYNVGKVYATARNPGGLPDLVISVSSPFLWILQTPNRSPPPQAKQKM